MRLPSDPREEGDCGDDRDVRSESEFTDLRCGGHGRRAETDPAALLVRSQMKVIGPTHGSSDRTGMSDPRAQTGEERHDSPGRSTCAPGASTRSG